MFLTVYVKKKSPDNLRHRRYLTAVASFRIWRGSSAVTCRASGLKNGKMGIRTPGTV